MNTIEHLKVLLKYTIYASSQLQTIHTVVQVNEESVMKITDSSFKILETYGITYLISFQINDLVFFTKRASNCFYNLEFATKSSNKKCGV